MLRLFYFSLSRLSDAATFFCYFRGYDSTRAATGFPSFRGSWGAVRLMTNDLPEGKKSQ